jgi:hypothetical protein
MSNSASVIALARAKAKQEPLTYEQEQELLARRQEGKDIRIEPPKEPEVNPEIYRDVVALLFRGFLTAPADINGARFVFKSLNHHEFELLRFCSGYQDDDSTLTYKFWDTLLAFNVFMVGGQNVLGDRERHLPKIADTFHEMDPKSKQRIIRQMSDVNRRANNAVHLTECYAMENYSRYRWAQLKGIDLCIPSATGIPGTESLGMNWAQLMWRALNVFEDRHEDIERDWDNAKFVGSCMAGKGIQKIYQQDATRRQKDREDRLAQKDKVLRMVLLGEKPIEKVRQLAGAVLTGAHSVEELASQLEGDLRGEQDWHDKVIEEHERRIKTNLQGRQAQVHEMAKRHEEEFGPRGLIGGTDFKGLSTQEVQELIGRRKQLENQRIARQMVRPEILQDPKSSQFLDKWGLTESEVGFSVGQTDQDPSTAIPIGPPKQGAGVPWRKR